MGVFVHSMERHGAAEANPLYGAEQTGKPLRLHGAAQTCDHTSPPIHPTANRPSILVRILSDRNPTSKSGSARPAVHELHGITQTGGPTVLHRAAQNVRHEPLHGIARTPCWSIASFMWAHVNAWQLPVIFIIHSGDAKWSSLRSTAPLLNRIAPVRVVHSPTPLIKKSR